MCRRREPQASSRLRPLSNPRLKDRTRLENHEVLLDLPPAFPLAVRKKALNGLILQVRGKHARHREADSVLGQEREHLGEPPSDTRHLKAQVDRAFAQPEPPDAVIEEVFIAKLEVPLSL